MAFHFRIAPGHPGLLRTFLTVSPETVNRLHPLAGVHGSTKSSISADGPHFRLRLGL